MAEMMNHKHHWKVDGTCRCGEVKPIPPDVAVITTGTEAFTVDTTYTDAWSEPETFVASGTCEACQRQWSAPYPDECPRCSGAVA